VELLFSLHVNRTLHEVLWDTTTIVLRKAIRQYVHPGDRVLDLGTGHLAVLSIYCAKKCGGQVVAVDINPRFLENGAEVARDSGSPPIEFVHSNWFSNLGDRRFDVIFADIPYMPTAVGERVGGKPELRQIWDGGADGYDHLRIILPQTQRHLTPHGRFLLGLNTMYVPRDQTISLIRSTPGLALQSIVRFPLWPSEVYVIALRTEL